MVEKVKEIENEIAEVKAEEVAAETAAVIEVKSGTILAKKVGMTQIFDAAGNIVPVTVLEAGPCTIVQVKTKEKEGYNAIQVGFGRTKKVNKPQTGHLKGDKLKNLREIRVEKTEEFKPGQVITVGSFKEGEMVSVTGVAVGKGFAGTIRRYHHNRGPMTHGSKAHRRPGAAGAGSTPGRVVKGRKMPGRMGGRQITEKRVQVVKVEPDKNLLYLRGPVPGKPGNLIVVSEA